jgi:hypothetical protein
MLEHILSYYSSVLRNQQTIDHFISIIRTLLHQSLQSPAPPQYACTPWSPSALLSTE